MFVWTHVRGQSSSVINSIEGISGDNWIPASALFNFNFWSPFLPQWMLSKQSSKYHQQSIGRGKLCRYVSICTTKGKEFQFSSKTLDVHDSKQTIALLA